MWCWIVAQLHDASETRSWCIWCGCVHGGQVIGVIGSYWTPVVEANSGSITAALCSVLLEFIFHYSERYLLNAVIMAYAIM